MKSGIKVKSRIRMRFKTYWIRNTVSNTSFMVFFQLRYCLCSEGNENTGSDGPPPGTYIVCVSVQDPDPV